MKSAAMRKKEAVELERLAKRPKSFFHSAIVERTVCDKDEQSVSMQVQEDSLLVESSDIILSSVEIFNRSSDPRVIQHMQSM
ncbi:hypothetical protein ACJMK2_010713 [Sinanodonta woodiana]|uniref:Uncharacterized protein n=1 Tax=Sinanodonta woodiana TaxID=1069815 RepID=A0ABD3VGA6_SINWO